MLVNILLVLHIIVSLLLGGAVLLQRSEGGALGMGGGPSGFMTARGTGDLLTRLTWSLFAAFLLLTILLTVILGQQRQNASVVTRGDIGAVGVDTLGKPPAAATPAPALPAAALPTAPAAPGAVLPGTSAEGALGLPPSSTPPAPAGQ
ncbi:MAG: preprotein translocase subunit SecG [Pseudomonadota bacterium]